VNGASFLITDRLAVAFLPLLPPPHPHLLSINITAYYVPRKNVLNKYYRTRSEKEKTKNNNK